ncbi:FAD-binding oxidoreductase [Streptomyces sp. NPDC052051]|uniref:FAD-binding oxidoreductase n=1 Tax=Streptomyces sp. NPDC052051 TaxID=3154649 RepID=UPI00343D6ABF
MPPFATARTALAALRADLAGEVLAPGDTGYDAARRVCNARVDRRPAVIARCAGPDDVVRAVCFARELDLRVAVRGGGHSVAGMGVNDNGVVIDLRRMRQVTVHPGAAAVRVEGGALTRDLDRATRPYGLATTGGRDSASGVAGFVLGGGSGRLERAFGPAVDQLLGAELVTADGTAVRATAEEHPELFWALHGGGGNFGVATALTLRLYELPEFSVALLGFRPETGPAAVRAFREIVASGPPEVSGAVLYLTARPEPFVPGHLVGTLLCLVVVTYVGGADRLRGFVRPLLALPHVSEVLAALPYADVQGMFDIPCGLRHHGTTEYLTALPDELVDVFCARARALPVPSGCRYALWPLAAAPAAYPDPRADATWAVCPRGVWADPADDARVPVWVEEARADVRPWRTGAVHVRLVGDEGRDRVVAGLTAEHLDKLARVKRRYDPDNMFRFNHNIRPV